MVVENIDMYVCIGMCDVHVVLCFSKLGINRHNELRIIGLTLIIVLILI